MPAAFSTYATAAKHRLSCGNQWYAPCHSGTRRGRVNMASEQESSNGPVKKSMREKAIERRCINKEHNSNFKAGYVPIEEERLHKTGLRGRKGNMAVCIVILLFLLALINLIITLVIWTVIRIGPNGCDSMEFHETGLLRFKQKADMGIVHPLHKSTVGGRKDQDLVLVGNNNPVVFQQGTTKLSVEKDKTSVVSDVGISFTDPRTQTTFFSTDFENHEFHLPKGVKITSSASSDLNIKGDSKAIIRGNEGVNIMGRTVEFKMGGGIELRAENSIVLNGSVMFNATRIPNSAGDVYFDEGMERYKLCMCADGTLFRVQVVMAVAQGPSLAAVLLLVSGLHCSALRPPCPESCSCHKAPLLNCSSSGLSLVPQHIQDSVTELDLSHNLLDTVTLDRPHFNLRSVLLGNNRLEGSESLQVLQLSFNRISTLRPGELSHLRQLKELHLRHNLITSLHPQMFQDLAQLRVLDLSFNVLTSLHPLIYLSLRNIGADVRLDGNRWQCDCSMRSLRRWLAYDSSRGSESWSMVCASPSSLSGRDMLQLEEDDLNCFGTERGPELHQEVTVYKQNNYENEAYYNDEEPEDVGTHRERRVTFSNVEDINVQYYDTIPNLESNNNDAVIECEAAEAEKDTECLETNQRDSREGIEAGRTHKIEFEHIPDPVELDRGRSSSCSDSSLSDETFNQDKKNRGDDLTPKSRQPAEDSVQQRADASTAGKVEGPREPPGFSSEPFADWSPHADNANLTYCDLGQENEEQFEFSDSIQSTSTPSGSACGSFNDSKLIVAPSTDKQKTDDMSSSSSYVSEDEVTQYIVNSDQEEEDIERNHNKPEITTCLKQDASFEQQIRPSVQYNQGDYRYDKHRPTVRHDDSFSSRSSDSDEENYTVKKGSVTSQGKSIDTQAPSLPAAYSSSSSSESEAEITDLKGKQSKDRVIKSIKITEPETLSTDLDGLCIPQMNKRVAINAPLPVSDSSSNDETMDLTTKHSNKQEQREVDMAGLPVKEFQSVSHDAIKPQLPSPIKRRAPLPPTNSSSSGERTKETMDQMQKQGETHMTMLPVGVSQKIGLDHPQPPWPALDLEHTTRIKRRLDIKAPSPASASSSSSDSEDETTHQTKRPGKVEITGLPLQESQTGSHDPDTRWPALDLEHFPRINRRLDIKAPPPDLSCKSGSEDETTIHIKNQEQGPMNMARLPSKVSQTGTYKNPQPQWPALELEHTTRIKRRLDIKAPSLASDSSSSSDSDDETIHHTERPRRVDIAGSKVSQTVSYDPQTQFPALDLDHTMRIKRRLDIKAPSPASDSSSSSDSEDETTHHTTKERPGVVGSAGHLFQESQIVSQDPETQWPALNLGNVTRIKRRLDIKAPSRASDSSSSSDSEDETIHQTKRPGKVDIVGPP
ncbi:hypothetical protein FQN60_013159, partial [Etheostoma spectabile]